MKTANDFSGLPGGELVTQGLADLRAGRVTEEALLLTFARTRLLGLGIDFQPISPLSERENHALYSFLEDKHGRDAYSRYNALLRRMSSFASALEREQSSAQRAIREGADWNTKGRSPCDERP